jgi:hypothetical protein
MPPIYSGLTHDQSPELSSFLAITMIQPGSMVPSMHSHHYTMFCSQRGRSKICCSFRRGTTRRFYSSHTVWHGYGLSSEPHYHHARQPLSIGIATDRIKQKRSNAVDMRYAISLVIESESIRDRVRQSQFTVYYRVHSYITKLGRLLPTNQNTLFKLAFVFCQRSQCPPNTESKAKVSNVLSSLLLLPLVSHSLSLTPWTKLNTQCA